VLCQTAIVNGVGQRLGAFTAVFSDRINFVTLTYTATGLITVTDGSTFSTTASGHLVPFPDGSVAFSEDHTVVAGTGQYTESAGTISISGTASPTGQLVITGTGTFNK
jgi:hypothetical protein